jgi:uncharacterized protein (TIGR02001 family)
MKLSIGAVVLVAALVTPLVGAAQTALSANAGWTSDYYFRGIFQKGSSASAGMDVEGQYFYAGTWAAGVGDGNEVDAYGGASWASGDFSASVGGTGYFYTGEFDRKYLEGNFNAGYGVISGEFSYGRHDLDQADPSDPDHENYWFAAITLEEAGFYLTGGLFGDSADGEYLEGGYGFTAAEVDFGIAWIYQTEAILGATEDNHTLVFSISKTFDLN